MANNERRVGARTQAVPRLPSPFCCFLFAALFLFPFASQAEPDKDMSGLIGKLEGIIGTNNAKVAATNEASLLIPPLPEIPPTP